METTLLEILEAREKRAAFQKQLLSDYDLPLVCFTMNIPGPIKDSPLIQKGFRLGLRRLEKILGSAIRYRQLRCTAAGWEAFLSVDMDAEKIKTLTNFLEDKLPGGRVYDMDVITREGKLSRSAERRCLICDQPAMICGRSRSHSVSQLQEKTFSLIRKSITEEVAMLAVQSLLCEVYATPKPGLVDQNGSGSHADMDLFTFLSSAAVLWPYFRRCAALGLEQDDPKLLFFQLREAGKEAEIRMLRATAGVNTHKGAIFSMGLLCGAAGMAKTWDSQTLCDLCCQMTRGLTQELEVNATPQTAGERIYAKYGISGARGQAEAGFPGAILGLEALEKGLEAGLTLNDALCESLLTIMAQTTDTNIVNRGGMEAQQWVWDILKHQPAMDELCRAFKEKNLSPGGSADLLAAACFLHFLK